MNATDKLMAMAQIWLSVLYLVFTFIVTLAYELGWAHLTADQDKSFSNSLNWLQTTAGIVVFFWFNRARTAGIPDPSQMVTQTHTLPDGTKTVTTSPAASPAPAPVNTEQPSDPKVF